MKAFANHFLFELRTGLRDKNLLLMNYLFPLGFFILIGLLMTKIYPGFNETLIPSMIIFSFLVSMILGMPSPIVTSREAGIFRTYKTNGIPAINIIIMPPLTTLLHTTLLSIIIISASHLFFNAPLPANWFWFILSLLITAFSLAGLGMLIGVISLNSRATILWSQLIFLPSMLIGGLMVPSSILPKALLKIGFLLPSTYAINMFQGLAQNQTVLFNPAWSIIILLGTGISAFGLAVYLFNWDSRNKTRKGNPFLAILALIPLIIGVIILP